MAVTTRPFSDRRKPARAGRRGAGRRLAARFAAHHGDRVKRRVLVDSHGLGRFRPLTGAALAARWGIRVLGPPAGGLHRAERH